MKRCWLFLLLLSLLAACAPEGSEGAYSVTLIVDGMHDYGPEDPPTGTLIVMGGDVGLAPGLEIDGLYLLGGQVSLGGEVTGDVNMIDGTLQLLPSAVVISNVNVAGGVVEQAPSAQVGAMREGASIAIPVFLGEREPRPPADVLVQAFVTGLILALAAAAFVRLRPRPLARVSQAGVRHALVSASLGLLALVVGIVLVVMMAFTIVLVPVSVMGLIGGLAVIVYGWMAYGYALGRALARIAPWQLSPPLAAFAGTLLFNLLLAGLGLIPTLGSILSIAISAAGFGAVLLTRLGARTFVPATATPIVEES